MAKDESQHRILEVLIHLMAWMMVFFFPQMMFVREEGFLASLTHMLPLLVCPALLAIVFYANYLWLVPSMLSSRDVRRFVVVNVLLILLMQSVNGLWDYSFDRYIKRTELDMWESEGMGDSLLVSRYGDLEAGERCPDCGTLITSDLQGRHHGMEVCSGAGQTYRYNESTKSPVYLLYVGSPGENEAQGWVFVLVLLRDFITYLFLVALAVVLHMSYRFHKAEIARKQAELRHTEAELQSLRNQISPHFLLNTLNNIYVLVMLDQAKAQDAIMNLSRLLSHMLYQNSDTCTPLEREVDFLRRYVDLMKLRISDGMRVEFVDNVSECGSLPIAPLVCVSLVENAFKHGVSGNDGYVSIRIIGSQADGTIQASIRNSNHPKSSHDKSGHGVGLQLVRRRLELLYRGRYTWQHGVDAEHNEYYSLLTIQTNEQDYMRHY